VAEVTAIKKVTGQQVKDKILRVKIRPVKRDTQFFQFSQTIPANKEPFYGQSKHKKDQC